MWDLAIVLLVAPLLGLAYHSWGWRGPAVLAAAAVGVNLVFGTIRWWRPHAEVAAIASRPQDWACHSLNVMPAILLLTSIPVLALRLAERRIVTRGGQAVYATIAMAAAIPITVVVSIYWVIQLLGCDAI